MARQELLWEGAQTWKEGCSPTVRFSRHGFGLPGGTASVITDQLLKTDDVHLQSSSVGREPGCRPCSWKGIQMTFEKQRVRGTRENLGVAEGHVQPAPAQEVVAKSSPVGRHGPACHW